MQVFKSRILWHFWEFESRFFHFKAQCWSGVWTENFKKNSRRSSKYSQLSSQFSLNSIEEDFFNRVLYKWDMFFRLETSFRERDINQKFRKKLQMFLYAVSIDDINRFFNEWENNNEIAGIPDFKLEYLAHTNWPKKSASGFLFCEPITTRIGWSRFCDRRLFFVCNTVL